MAKSKPNRRKKKLKKKKRVSNYRNPFALSASLKNSSGPMKHKTAPKKGAKNMQNLLKENEH
jgi:predicted amidophosphoribosyltransferase